MVSSQHGRRLQRVIYPNIQVRFLYAMDDNPEDIDLIIGIRVPTLVQVGCVLFARN